MKRFWMLLFAVALIASVSPQISAGSGAVPSEDKMAKARQEEEKGDLARAHRNYESAFDHYAAAVRIERQSANLYNKLGITEIKMNQLKDARKHFNLALKLAPSNYLTLNNLGTVAYLEYKYKNAMKFYKQALALNETSAVVHLNLAEAWIQLGEMDYAMTEYSRALELDGDVGTTNQDGVQSRISTPEQRARVNFLIAKAYARNGNLDGALDFLNRAKEGRFPELSRVYKDKDFAPLWKDPRLAKIVKR